MKKGHFRQSGDKEEDLNIMILNVSLKVNGIVTADFDLTQSSAVLATML